MTKNVRPKSLSRFFQVLVDQVFAAEVPVSLIVPSPDEADLNRALPLVITLLRNTPPAASPFTTNLVENVERLKLDVQRVAHIHGGVSSWDEILKAAGR